MMKKLLKIAGILIISTPGLKHVVRTHAETLLKHDVCISKLALGKDGDPATVWERIYKRRQIRCGCFVVAHSMFAFARVVRVRAESFPIRPCIWPGIIPGHKQGRMGKPYEAVVLH